MLPGLSILPIIPDLTVTFDREIANRVILKREIDIRAMENTFIKPVRMLKLFLDLTIKNIPIPRMMISTKKIMISTSVPSSNFLIELKIDPYEKNMI